MSTVDVPAPRRNLVARHLSSGQLAGISWLFAAFAAVIILAGIAIELVFEVTGSIWSGALQIPRWFAIGMGVYLTAVYLPVYIAHGRTRREIATGSAIFAVGFAAALGAAAVVGFAIEVGIYNLIGWANLLPDPHAVSSLPQTATTFAVQTSVFLVWVTVGSLGGAAFYRSAVIGFAVVPLGLALIGLSTVATGLGGSGIPLPDVIEQAPPILGAMACVAAAVLAMALTWPIVRDIPVRSNAR